MPLDLFDLLVKSQSDRSDMIHHTHGATQYFLIESNSTRVIGFIIITTAYKLLAVPNVS